MKDDVLTRFYGGGIKHILGGVVEVATLVLVCFSVVIGLINMFCLLMLGSVMVQVMEVLNKLPEEVRSPRKREGERPWYTYV